MPDSDDPAKRREADNPTRLQRVARRGCVGLAYAIVLVPVVLVIWFFSTIPRGWEQFGDLVWKVISEGSPGAHTQITIVNESGHDVQIDLMQFDEVPVAFSGLWNPSEKVTANKRAFTTKQFTFRISTFRHPCARPLQGGRYRS